ncbi:uncharacterized protein LOC144130433 [Amblyomma americanum]
MENEAKPSKVLDHPLIPEDIKNKIQEQVESFGAGFLQKKSSTSEQQKTEPDGALAQGRKPSGSASSGSGTPSTGQDVASASPGTGKGLVDQLTKEVAKFTSGSGTPTTGKDVPASSPGTGKGLAEQLAKEVGKLSSVKESPMGLPSVASTPLRQLQEALNPSADRALGDSRRSSTYIVACFAISVLALVLVLGFVMYSYVIRPSMLASSSGQKSEPRNAVAKDGTKARHMTAPEGLAPTSAPPGNFSKKQGSNRSVTLERKATLSP